MVYSYKCIGRKVIEIFILNLTNMLNAWIQKSKNTYFMNLFILSSKWAKLAWRAKSQIMVSLGERRTVTGHYQKRLLRFCMYVLIPNTESGFIVCLLCKFRSRCLEFKQSCLYMLLEINNPICLRHLIISHVFMCYGSNALIRIQ